MAENPVEEDTLRILFDATILKTFLNNQESEEIGHVEPDLFQKCRAKFRNIVDNDTDFYVVYHCANMAATWMSLLSISILRDMNDQRAEDPLDEQLAALAFFSRLANDLWAIIQLVELGFDLQARALTRAYLEHVDVLICCIQDRELTREFVGAREPKAANAFWHKHVSKNRAKAKVTKFITSVLGLNTATVVNILREDADLAGSALLHPTVVAGLLNAFGDPDADYEDSYPIFPHPVTASAGILRTILMHLFWLSFATRGQPSNCSGAWQPIFRAQSLQGDLEMQSLSLLYNRMFQFLLDNEILIKPTTDDLNIKA